jgi:hypothetical protein
MKRNPSRPSFEDVNKENGCSGIYVSHAQSERFSEAKSGAVEDQNQRPVERRPKPRPVQCRAKRQQIENILLGKNIRNER